MHYATPLLLIVLLAGCAGAPLVPTAREVEAAAAVLAGPPQVATDPSAVLKEQAAQDMAQLQADAQAILDELMRTQAELQAVRAQPPKEVVRTIVAPAPVVIGTPDGQLDLEGEGRLRDALAQAQQAANVRLEQVNELVVEVTQLRNEIAAARARLAEPFGGDAGSATLVGVAALLLGYVLRWVRTRGLGGKP